MRVTSASCPRNTNRSWDRPTRCRQNSNVSHATWSASTVSGQAETSASSCRVTLLWASKLCCLGWLGFKSFSWTSALLPKVTGLWVTKFKPQSVYPGRLCSKPQTWSVPVFDRTRNRNQNFVLPGKHSYHFMASLTCDIKYCHTFMKRQLYVAISFSTCSLSVSHPPSISLFVCSSLFWYFFYIHR